MPAVSSQQQRWAYAVKGKAWAEKHHFDNPGKKPKYSVKSKAKTRLALALKARK